MSDTPLETPPPPPPPQKPKTGRIVAIVAGVLLLCLCCVALGVGLYIGRDQIARLFSSAVPLGARYDSTSMGFSLYYPTSWIYEEDESAVVFATSQEVIDGSSSLTSGAGLIVLRSPDMVSILTASSADVSSPEDILNLMVDPQNGLGLGEVVGGLQPLTSFTVQGDPAASAAYTISGETGSPDLVGYYIVIVPQSTAVFIIAVCPQAEWALHQPTFDGIVASLEIGPMP
jgi:hypothetical protein